MYHYISRKRVIFTGVLIIIVFFFPPFYASSSALEGNQIEQLKYLLEFKFQNSVDKTNFNTYINLEINHTGFEFPGNGTIKYIIEDPIADVRLLYMLYQVLPIEFVDYFSDPASAEFLLTYYFNRTESPDPFFNTSKSYTIFWMHEELNDITNFISFGRVYFFNTSSPLSLAIDDVVTISHGTKRWSETFGGKLFDTHISTCFILSLDIQIGDDETYFHMYYDRSTGMLSYGKFYVKQVTNDGKTLSELEIHHVSSTFPIMERFNWLLLLTITVFSGAGAILIWIFYNLIRNGYRKKPSRLDQL